MDYKLIAIDMDGTLLNNKNNISAKNIETIHKAMDKGIHIVLATGRILASAKYFSRHLKLDKAIVACNGAIVSSGNGEDIFFERKLEAPISKKLVDLAREYKIDYRFSSKDTLYTKLAQRDGEEFYPSHRENLMEQGIRVKILEDPVKTIEVEKPDIYKFEFVEENKDKLLYFRNKLQTIEGINIASSWHNNVEVMGEGISKGKALEYLCQKYKINKSQIVSIGDNENDISMFKVSGLAIAMANSNNVAKKYSHIITSSNNEDGVARAIEKYVLQ